MVLSLKKLDNSPTIRKVHVTNTEIVVDMSDGRKASISFNLFPRLLEATPEQRFNLELSPSGYGIHWPEIDEDISVQAFLY